MSVEVIGQSALGRPLYGVVFNAMETPQQIQDYNRWDQYRGIALEDPARAQELLDEWGDDIKVPVFVNGAIHGNEYEGVESNMQLIKELATTPYGVNPKFDDILDHVILVFNVIQNPDGRVAGTRANGNGFDMNRDFLTQSQSEVRASVALIQKWLPVEVLDLHGYVTPTLIEATTKPHNPSIEYDLWLKWNQPRIDANEAAMNASRASNVTRPINDWCADGEHPRPARRGGVCADGTGRPARQWPRAGTTGARSTRRCTHSTSGSTAPRSRCATSRPRGLRRPGDRRTRAAGWAPSRSSTSSRPRRSSTWSTTATRCSTTRRSAIAAASRASPASTAARPPFDVDNNWMKEFPDAYVIPVGTGQRSERRGQAPRRLAAPERDRGRHARSTPPPSTARPSTRAPTSSGWIRPIAARRHGAQHRRRRLRPDQHPLRASCAAWSHGYLWGADIVEIPLDSDFSPITNRIIKTTTPKGGVEAGPRRGLRARARLGHGRADAQLADRRRAHGRDGLDAFPAADRWHAPGGHGPLRADHATMVELAQAGRDNGLLFRRVVTEDFPSSTDPIDRVPRILPSRARSTRTSGRSGTSGSRSTVDDDGRSTQPRPIRS